MSTCPFGVVNDDGYLDQVVRKQKFMAGHPEWEVTFVQPEGRPGYHQFRRVRGSQEAVITDHYLERALDRAIALVELESGQ